ncbi:MAG: hypothetical protein KDC95_14120 [Planctomycetes bacterium]|nr:hypothetical protein [Planctomycetota bacterium]
MAIAAIVFVGWRTMYFECDDAYINFRYVSNAMLGRGFVFNPEPFVPVEGYTAFLWLVVLRFVWWSTGVEPPIAAHWITLAFGFATLALGWRLLLRIGLTRVLAVLVILATATNRVFLTWLTSGLETSMFVFLLTAWVFVVSATWKRTWLWAFALGTTATLVALTRPDGLLCVLASGGLLIARVWTGNVRVATATFGMLPMLGIAVHMLWRKSLYGMWLPNTYYAKHTAWWPESGLRYAASYCIENGVWLWSALVVIWVVVEIVRRNATRELVDRHLGTIAATGVVIAHFGYYTFAIGGDIFEYRVYAHLAFFVLASGAFMAQRVFGRGAVTLVAFGLLVLATHGFAWLHYVDSGKLEQWLPRAVHPVLSEYRSWQAWLHERMVGVRHDKHMAFVEHLKLTTPPRSEGATISWDDRPIYVGTAAGVVSWCLPNVAVLDVYGLNDAVIARNAAPSDEERRRSLLEARRQMFDAVDTNHDAVLEFDELRPAFAAMWPTLADRAETVAAGTRQFLDGQDLDQSGTLTFEELFPNQPLNIRRMGHERVPPPGYIEGFRPNVRIEGGHAIVDPRTPPLTDEEIRKHERAARDR